MRISGRGKVVIHDHWGDHLAPWLSGLKRHFEDRQVPVEVWDRRTFRRGGLSPLKRPYRRLLGLWQRRALRSIVEDVDHMFIWNGQNDHHQLLIQRCAEAGVPVSFLEVGYFPQKKFFTVDPRGINATSALMEDSLDWVGEAELRALEEFRESYLGARKWTGDGGFTLVPLQLASDTNIRDHSPFGDMQAFIRHCESAIEGPIVFKVHPLDDLEYESSHEVRRSGDFLDMAQRATRVVGLNSTCLLESALLGAPTEALGDGFLRAHQHRQEKLLAALVHRQIPVDAQDITPWLDRYAARRVNA